KLMPSGTAAGYGAKKPLVASTILVTPVLSGPESAARCARASFPWPASFPPSPPLPIPRLGSATSQVLRRCPTSHVRSSSVHVLGLPASVCSSLNRRQTWDLPVPAQGACMHARGL